MSKEEEEEGFIADLRRPLRPHRKRGGRREKEKKRIYQEVARRVEREVARDMELANLRGFLAGVRAIAPEERPPVDPCFQQLISGNCRRYPDCPFRHTGLTQEDFQRVRRFCARRPCFDFQQGRCTRGADCIYAHK